DVWNALPSLAETPSAGVPDGVRIYAIGDVHGRADLVARLSSWIDADVAARPISRPIQIFLGDYIDRGPNSREVIDSLIERGLRHETVFLKGNHEVMLTGFLRDPAALRDWQKFGGLQTLMSYGVFSRPNVDPSEEVRVARALAQALPESHHRFLASLRSWF